MLTVTTNKVVEQTLACVEQLEVLGVIRIFKFHYNPQGTVVAMGEFIIPLFLVCISVYERTNTATVWYCVLAV